MSISYFFPLPIATETKAEENFRLVVLKTVLSCFYQPEIPFSLDDSTFKIGAILVVDGGGAPD